MMKYLARSETDQVILGVCSGLAHYLKIPPIFVRGAFVLLIFASGIGVFLYLVLVVLLPSERDRDLALADFVQSNLEDLAGIVAGIIRKIGDHPRGPMIAGTVLILMGIYLIVQTVGWMSGTLLPLGVIILAIYLYRQNQL